MENENELRVLTLEEIHQQLSVDYDDDDATLLLMGTAAEDAVIDETRRTLEELTRRGYYERTGIEVESAEEVPGGATAYFPRRLKQAMLLLVADLYKNRELTTEKALNRVKTYDILTKPYRRLV